MTLVNESGIGYWARYLAHKPSLSGGWRHFAEKHHLDVGDAVVFELIDRLKFQTHIFRRQQEQPNGDTRVEEEHHFLANTSNVASGSKVEKEVIRNDDDDEDVSTLPIGMYAVQCGKCCKMRVIPTLEEFEEIRENFLQHPYFCDKKHNVSCDDLADIEYDNANTWVIDKPTLPRAPDGFKREIVVRSDFSGCDLYYILPTGDKARSLAEIEQFLKANPQLQRTVRLSNFTFISPKVMQDTHPSHVGTKKRKQRSRGGK